MPDPVSQFPDLPDTFDLAELKGVFTEEEIKALSEGDDPVVVLPDPAAKQDPDPASLQAEDDEVLKTALEAQQKANPAPAPAAETQPPAQVEQQPAAEEEPGEPVLEVPDTTAAEATVQALETQIDALQQKYDDGDLTATEMKAQMAALVKEQAKAQAVIDSAAQIIETAQQRANEAWVNSLNKFKDAGNADLWSDTHRAGFDAQLKLVTSNPDNTATMKFPALIRLAAQQYAAAYEARTGQKLELNKAPAPPVPAQQQQQQQQRRPDAPQLLGNLNGDGGLSKDDGRFTAIDRIANTDPFQAEREMARLSAVDMEAYLRGE